MEFLGLETHRNGVFLMIRRGYCFLRSYKLEYSKMVLLLLGSPYFMCAQGFVHSRTDYIIDNDIFRDVDVLSEVLRDG